MAVIQEDREDFQNKRRLVLWLHSELLQALWKEPQRRGDRNGNQPETPGINISLTDCVWPDVGALLLSTEPIGHPPRPHPPAKACTYGEYQIWPHIETGAAQHVVLFRKQEEVWVSHRTVCRLPPWMLRIQPFILTGPSCACHPPTPQQSHPVVTRSGR